MGRGPSLKECLAYEVLTNRLKWLGQPSMRALACVLYGAELRASLTRRNIPTWRIYGPLESPDFYLPIVARTGHPTVTIKWATALELLYFSLDAAADWLLDEMRRFVKQHGFDTTPLTWPDLERETLETTFRTMARWPAMFLGTDAGWDLRCYLAGMNEGGDWLRLPRLPGLRRVIRAIERRSQRAYGSPFGTYRINDAKRLLKAAGIEPIDDHHRARYQACSESSSQAPDHPVT